MKMNIELPVILDKNFTIWAASLQPAVIKDNKIQIGANWFPLVENDKYLEASFPEDISRIYSIYDPGYLFYKKEDVLYWFNGSIVEGNTVDVYGEKYDVGSLRSRFLDVLPSKSVVGVLDFIKLIPAILFTTWFFGAILQAFFFPLLFGGILVYAVRRLYKNPKSRIGARVRTFRMKYGF